MSEQQCCGTCAHWLRSHTPARGECRWDRRVAHPWWYLTNLARPAKTTETEGEDCDAWEKKE